MAEKDEDGVRLFNFNKTNAYYLQQLGLTAPWTIFYYATEIEWLDWDELKEELENEGCVSIYISELDEAFTRVKCPPGYLLVGAINEETKDKTYGFVISK